MVKIVQFPGGPTDEEANVIGAERQVRIDISKGSMRVHDGITPGGKEIPTVEMVRLMLGDAESGGNTEAIVGYFATEDELAEAVPQANMIAVLNENGKEDIFTWKNAVNDGGGIDSLVLGYWQRLDGRLGQWIRMWRAGQINLQIDGAQPVALQDTTAWSDNGTVKLWDGAAYLAVTPVLYARLIRKIGVYDALGALPNRLADTLVAAANLNVVTDSGWYKSAAADANAPSATVSPVYHQKIDANTMMQIFYLQGSSNRDTYVRWMTGGAWGTWVLVPGILPLRLEAVSSVVTDCNNALDSGFYHISSAGSNMPVAVNGNLYVSRYSSTEATQLFISSGSSAVYARRYTGSAWQAWYLLALDSLVMKLAGNQTVTGGFGVTPGNLGTIATQTLNALTNGNYQYGTNNGAVTLTAPAADCAIDIMITNGAAAGAITLSGFTVAASNTGDAFTLTNGHRFLLMIRRINSISTYVVKALQ